jgi:hypothetical protein
MHEYTTLKPSKVISRRGRRKRVETNQDTFYTYIEMSQ